MQFFLEQIHYQLSKTPYIRAYNHHINSNEEKKTIIKHDRMTEPFGEIS